VGLFEIDPPPRFQLRKLEPKEREKGSSNAVIKRLEDKDNSVPQFRALERMSAGFIGFVFHPGLIGNPVHFPRFASIIRE